LSLCFLLIIFFCLITFEIEVFIDVFPQILMLKFIVCSSHIVLTTSWKFLKGFVGFLTRCI
jgi:hypothetical protein